MGNLNSRYEQRRYNARLQPTQIGLGTNDVANPEVLTQSYCSQLLLGYQYGADRVHILCPLRSACWVVHDGGFAGGKYARLRQASRPSPRLA